MGSRSARLPFSAGLSGVYQADAETEKALEIAGTGANVISGSDQACLMNIAGMLDRLHKEGEIDRRIKVMHIAEILNCR